MESVRSMSFQHLYNILGGIWGQSPESLLNLRSTTRNDVQWRIQGRGLGPPLFLDQTEARRAKKQYFGDQSPPPPLISGSA